MVFNSLEFLLFFPIVSMLYFGIPHAWRWALLLVASCLFYMAFIPQYILILFFTIIVDYFAGIWIEKSQGTRRKLMLAASIVANVGVLAYFKYFNFFLGNVNAFNHVVGWNHDYVLNNIILPIGLSFHTFQAMSYTIEVYRGKQAAERHLGIYSLYVMFYPQLVAGPIERPQNLLPQFRERHYFNYARVVSGLQLMAWGLFKKVVIADHLAVITDTVYKNPANFSGLFLTLATVAFAYQIYCDFSGYSDIALGSAEVMGFHLMRNFRQPYHARTISDFWRRWHISLSTWFKDYVYIPLGGNRVGQWRQMSNLFITFLISGFWHGAAWTYVAWGALHGFYLCFGMLTANVRETFRRRIGLSAIPWLQSALQIAIIFILVDFAWIFFRAGSFGDAIYIIRNLHTGWSTLGDGGKFLSTLQGTGVTPADLLYVLAALVVLKGVHQVQRRGSCRQLIAAQPAYVRWPIYYTGFASIVLLGVFGKPSFIYFQF